jgi:hypothetical protein
MKGKRLELKFPNTKAEYNKLVGVENPKDFDPEELVPEWSFLNVYRFLNKLSVFHGKEPCYSMNEDTNPDNWEDNHDLARCNSKANGYRFMTEDEYMEAETERLFG